MTDKNPIAHLYMPVPGAWYETVTVRNVTLSRKQVADALYDFGEPDEDEDLSAALTMRLTDDALKALAGRVADAIQDFPLVGDEELNGIISDEFHALLGEFIEKSDA